jgi:hypothetical protein
MPKEESPIGKAAAGSSLSARPLPAPQPKTSSAPVLKRPVAAASVAKAKKAFNSFSLSKFAGDALPPHYVAPGQSPAEAQRRKISQHLDTLKNAVAPTRAMTIALPDATLKELLPSLDTKAGTIDLADVMSLIQKNMGGTEFYANGNPTLNRIAVQAQVQQIIDNIKQDGKK